MNSQRSSNFVHAIRVLQKLEQIDDPFYTPFALATMAQCYSALGHRDLEIEVFKRVIKLPEEQKLLLNPGWLATCYQRAGDLKTAREILHDVQKLAPSDVYTISALAEISLLQNDLGEAETLAAKLENAPNLHIKFSEE